MRPLGIAYANGHEKIVQFLIHEEADRQWKDGSRECLLHFAARGPDHGLTRAHLNDEHDVDSEGFPGAILLHCAAAHGRRLNGELLIAAKADLEQRNSDRETPLW